jgi:hypothetical protein
LPLVAEKNLQMNTKEYANVVFRFC